MTPGYHGERTLSLAEAKGWQPKVVLVDSQNGVVDDRWRELAGPKRR